MYKKESAKNNFNTKLVGLLGQESEIKLLDGSTMCRSRSMGWWSMRPRLRR